MKLIAKLLFQLFVLLVLVAGGIGSVMYLGMHTLNILENITLNEHRFVVYVLFTLATITMANVYVFLMMKFAEWVDGTLDDTEL